MAEMNVIQDRMEAKIDANQEKMLAKMNADQEKIDVNMDADQEKLDGKIEVSCLVSELVKGLLRFSVCELLLLEAGS
jgi:hypothetical protein